MTDTLYSFLALENLRTLGTAIAIVVGFALAGRLLLFFLSTVIHRLTRRTGSRVDDIILQALQGPIVWAITLLGITLAYRLYHGRLHPDWNTLIEGAIFVGFALTAHLAVYRLLRDLIDWYIHDKAATTQTPLDDLLLPFARRMLLITIGSVLVILILQHFEVQVGSFLATLGVGSLAVALAAQATLSDLISGFFILLDRRYRIGDRIELVGDGILGDVREIGLRTTRLTTQDNRMIIVPNSRIANNIVVNHAYPDPTLRVDLPIEVAYGCDIRHVKAVLLKAIRQVEGVQRDRQPDIIFHKFGESGIGLEMRCWINAFADKPKLSDRINEAAYIALNEAGIPIPYPQRVLWHRAEEAAIPALQRVFNGHSAHQGVIPSLPSEENLEQNL